METQAQPQPLRPNRFFLLLKQPWAARLIATLGIVVMTVGLYAPCAGIEIRYHADSVTIIRTSETWTIANAGVVAPVIFILCRFRWCLGKLRYTP